MQIYDEFSIKEECQGAYGLIVVKDIRSGKYQHVVGHNIIFDEQLNGMNKSPDVTVERAYNGVDEYICVKLSNEILALNSNGAKKNKHLKDKSTLLNDLDSMLVDKSADN